MPPLPPLLALLAAAPTVAMNGHQPSSADLDGMVALGASAVRVDFNWFQFEPSQGSYDFSAFDAIVQGANARGIAVYPTVAYTPQWASSVPSCVQSDSDATLTCNNKLPANTTDWTDAVTTVVTRYAGQVACWGIWNEPNLGGFFQGTEDDFVNQIFVPAAAAIRAADPSAKICGPELSGLTASSSWNGSNGTCVFGQCIRNGWELDLGQMLDRVGGSIDIITQHMYESDAPGVVTALVDGEYVGTLLTHDSVKDVIAQHGGAGKPFWLTETGWEHQPTGPDTLAQVATNIVALYTDEEAVCDGTYSSTDANLPWPAWQRTFYYHYPYDPSSGWGIVDAGEVPLPPYTALQAWTSGQTTTACTGMAPPDAGLDAGAPPDAGSSDSGTDAGASGGADAGLSSPDSGSSVPAPDGGGSLTSPGQGCGCSAAPGVLGLAALAAFARRKRRH